jgi:competence protein ComEC
MVLGILCANYAPAFKLVYNAAAIGLLVVCIAIALVRTQAQRSIAIGVCTFILALAAGAFVMQSKQGKGVDYHYSQFASTSTALELEIVEPLHKAMASFKTTAYVKSILPTGTQASGEVLVYFTRTDSMPQVLPGQRLLVSARLVPIRNNGNPNEFDYVQYCKRKQISHCIFVTPGTYVPVPSATVSLRGKFALWRVYLLQTLHKYFKEPNVLGIAEALLVGDKRDVDKDTWDAYSKTGVVHIIAISGMHLAMIYNALLWIFSMLPVLKQRPKFAIVCALICMWAFALLTGLPASVMRAAVAWSFVGTGTLISRKSNGVNMLCASAMVLLVYNPLWLFDIGFLLSYAALLGILLFSTRWAFVARNWHPALKKCWEIVCSTIAAQVFTLPICLYYFGQFPLLFLFSNLIAILLSSVALLLVVAVAIFGSFSITHTLAAVVAYLASFIIKGLNGAIYFFADFSFALSDIYVAPGQFAASAAAVSLVCIGFLQRSKHALWGALLLLIACTSGTFVRNLSQLRQQHLIVFNTSKCTTISFITGKKATTWCNKNVGSVKQYVLDPAFRYFGVVHRDTLASSASGFQVIQYGKKQMLVCQYSTRALPAVADKCQLVLLGGNSSITLADVASAAPHAQVIVDASNSLWKIERWKQETLQVPLRVHYTADSGAFVANY